MAPRRWDIITGEYPPQRGGVSDYTQQIASGLSACGDTVHVWAPGPEDAVRMEHGVEIHRLPGCFGPRAIWTMERAFSQMKGPRRLLVQYVPHAFGWKALNVLFCLWLLVRRHDEIWAMFHEVSFPLSRRQSLRHNFLGMVTLGMAAAVARGADRIFISTPAWRPRLQRLVPRAKLSIWMPVPTNISTSADPAEVRVVRRRIAGVPGAALIGHFSSYSTLTAPLLVQWLGQLLMCCPSRAGLVIGYHSSGYADEILRQFPALASRLHSIENLDRREVAVHLAACDILVQPYADGVSTRRTSMMAALALGMPIITNHGPATEPLWSESGSVALTLSGSPDDVVRIAEDLLARPGLRAELGSRAAGLYAREFVVERTINQLRSL